MQRLWQPLPVDHPFPPLARWTQGLDRLRRRFDAYRPGRLLVAGGWLERGAVDQHRLAIYAAAGLSADDPSSQHLARCNSRHSVRDCQVVTARPVCLADECVEQQQHIDPDWRH